MLEYVAPLLVSPNRQRAKSWQTVYVEQYKLNAVTTITVLNGIEINSEQFSAGTKRPRTGNVAEIVSAGNKRS
jgi:hypothetical protein